MLPSENALIGPRALVATQEGRMLDYGRNSTETRRQDAASQRPAGRQDAGKSAAGGGGATLYSFLYSTSRKTSVTLGGTVLATSLAGARSVIID